MPLAVALSALIAGILLAIAPAMLIHDDPTMGIIDPHGDSDANSGNQALGRVRERNKWGETEAERHCQVNHDHDQYC